MNQKTSPNKGFTLVELAVSLVVIGLLIGLGTAMVGPLMTAIKVRETKETIGGVVESVNSWASGNNSLPSVAGFDSAVKTPLDSWGRRFVYLYDSNLIGTTKDTICGRKTTAITLTDANTGANIQNVAYAIVSQGESPSVIAAQYLSTTLDGAPLAGSQALTGAHIIALPALPTVTPPYADDDIVRWVTLDELRTKVGCQGAQLKIVNNELPYGYAGSNYSAILHADGGVAPASSYRWCVEVPSTTPLPATLTFSPTVTVRLTPATSCNGLVNGLVEQNWSAASSTLSISGMPATGTQNSYQLTVYVRDYADLSGDSGIPVLPNDNDNVAYKPFVLTINPQ